MLVVGVRRGLRHSGGGALEQRGRGAGRAGGADAGVFGEPAGGFDEEVELRCVVEGPEPGLPARA